MFAKKGYFETKTKNHRQANNKIPIGSMRGDGNNHFFMMWELATKSPSEAPEYLCAEPLAETVAQSWNLFVQLGVPEAVLTFTTELLQF